ncbi:nitrate ABC transporter substrate-binding protein [Subtercola boreus]|uniref:Nitrate ABC transporter substrate-binding protein n=1 Tax=Subtercola boreus TaxID=120213 RepID=A0A3E0VE57_9MICO|nr:ABC transporter substrate-binding protein [Subtercola boreus]RFA08206.1 nitrate ABC transporter substrate-binding protein [Subtercola boreus]TQL54899.1 ABC-type nitrate/sulfonate/bicarbonate transport system substrate-binding protein [Subtercola boreus]
MPTHHRRLAASAGALAATALLLSACSTGSSPSAPTSAASLTVGSVDLAAAGCPANVVIQTGWNPEAEHGHLYELLGDDYTVDAGKKVVSGPLMAKGSYTGVNVEIRAGGPATGYQTVTSLLYSDPSITLGYVSTDESISQSATMPTTAVFASHDISPLMIMWDPSAHPDVTDIAGLVKSGAIIRYFGGTAYMSYLTAAGIIPVDQTDGSYDGTPAAYVASGGKDAQQGYASAEPYVYENEVAAWMKPVKYQLVDDLGFRPYQDPVVVRTADVETQSSCLKALVPVLQQAEVDYFAAPDAANALILDLVDQYDTGWVYTKGVADYSVKTMLDEKISGNGDNETIGDFDEARVQDLIDKVTPVFQSQGITPAEGLAPGDLVTNQFLDTSIGMAG